MGIDTVLPDHILRRMSADDRKKLGKAGVTKAGAQEAQTHKSEKELQQAIEQYCRLHDYPCYRMRMDKRSTGKVGTPDFLICVKGCFVAIECKVGYNQPSQEQAKELARIAVNGGYAKVCYTIQQAIEFLMLIEEENK